MLEIAALLALFLVLVLAAVHVAILANLPEELVLDREVEEEDLPGPVRELVRAFEQEGFERMGAALHVPLRPPAVLVPLLRRDEAAYAGVIQAASTPPRTVFEIVTRFEQEDAVLCTAQDPSAGVLPARDADFRQIFPGADAATLHARHREAVRFLREHGLRPLPATPAAYEEGLRASFPRLRAVFRRAPVRNTAVAITRTIRKRSPYEGPLADQPDTARRLRALTGALLVGS